MTSSNEVHSTCSATVDSENLCDKIDQRSITLTEDDIDDPTVRISTQQLANYDVNHLRSWLLYRGDTLKGLHNKRETQVRVMQYFKLGTEKKIIDPTPDKKWLKKKAMALGYTLREEIKGITQSTPCGFETDINNLSSSDGWSKLLEGLPNFSSNKIETYAQKINASVTSRSTVVKKHFKRGEQLLEEHYVDVKSVHAKQSDDYFCVKGVCAASLKKQNRWVFVALEKETADVSYAFCQCPAGKAGTCSHAFAVMKLIAKWVLDKVDLIPEPIPCTSRPCVWSVPQSHDRVTKPPISDLAIISPQMKKRPGNTTETQPAKQRATGITSTLYDPRCESKRTTNDTVINKLKDTITAINPNLHILSVINQSSVPSVETQFGAMPAGSTLAVQCSLMPADFNVYCTIQDQGASNQNIHEFSNFPSFPFQPGQDVISQFVADIIDTKKLAILKGLEITLEEAHEIESATRDQSENPKWFKQRENRFTASLCNKLGSNKSKTTKGLQNLAHNITHGSEKENQNKVLQFKLSYGKYNEPVAIQLYEKYMRLAKHSITVETCGLVVDPNNYILGSTPDGRVFCDGQYGILEVKCSEEYKDIDPKDICFIAKNPCIIFDESSNTISINKNHTYYDQIQMQLALTTATWCDFVFYTSKGLVINRVDFCEAHWKELCEKIVHFYFNYMLDEIVKKA